MRLLDLRLEGFGKLVNRAFQFAPGLNLVIGPNEAGKSTLMRALVTMLYSFFDDGTITAAKRSSMAGYQPWDERARFAGELRYMLDGGATYGVRRVFAPRSSTSLIAYPGEEDVTEQYDHATRGRLFFANAQLGLNKDTFERVCQIRLADLAARDLSASGIVATLMRLATSAAGDGAEHSSGAAADAVEALERVIREDIGTPRAQARPLPQLQAHLIALEERREAAAGARADVLRLTAQIRAAETRLTHVERERQEGRYLQLRAEQEQLARRLRAVSSAEGEVDRERARVEAWARWAEFPAHLHDRAIRLSARHAQLAVEHDKGSARIVAARERLAQLEVSRAEADARIATLEQARQTRMDILPDVEDLSDVWRQAEETYHSALVSYERAKGIVDRAGGHLAGEAEQLDPAVELGHVGLAKLEQRWLLAHEQLAAAEGRLATAEAEWARVGMSEDRFQRLEETVRSVTSGEGRPAAERRGCLGGIAALLRPQAAAVVGVPAEVLMVAQVGPIHAGLERARAEAERVRAALTEVRDEASSRLGALLPEGEPGPEALARLGGRLETFLSARADVAHHRALVASLKDDLEVVRARRDVAAGDLLDVLHGAGYGGDDAETVLGTYRAQIERRRELERAEHEREQLLAAAQDVRGEVSRWEERVEERDAAEAALRALFAEAGVATGDGLEDALVSLEEGVSGHGAWLEACQAYDAALKHLEALTLDGSRAELEVAAGDSARRVAALDGQHPEWATLVVDRGPDEYETRAQEAEEESAALRAEAAELRAKIDGATAVARTLAEIDEEIAVTRAEVQRLERFRDAALLAQRALTEAAEDYQRQFAPRLEPVLKESLGRVTRQRYVDAQVDPETLAVSLVAPEVGRPVPVEVLSAGTGDLVYLMLRMAIAQAVSGNRERLPLFLDDPMAQCDQERQTQVLEYLALLAGQTQILLFTKDDAARSWFEGALAGQEAHALHLLG